MGSGYSHYSSPGPFTTCTSPKRRVDSLGFESFRFGKFYSYSDGLETRSRSVIEMISPVIFMNEWGLPLWLRYKVPTNVMFIGSPLSDLISSSHRDECSVRLYVLWVLWEPLNRML